MLSRHTCHVHTRKCAKLLTRKASKHVRQTERQTHSDPHALHTGHATKPFDDRREVIMQLAPAPHVTHTFASDEEPRRRCLRMASTARLLPLAIARNSCFFSSRKLSFLLGLLWLRELAARAQHFCLDTTYRNNMSPDQREGLICQ